MKSILDVEAHSKHINLLFVVALFVLWSKHKPRLIIFSPPLFFFCNCLNISLLACFGKNKI